MPSLTTSRFLSGEIKFTSGDCASDDANPNGGSANDGAIPSDDYANGDAPIGDYASDGELGGTPNGDDGHDANHNGGRASFAPRHCLCRLILGH